MNLYCHRVRRSFCALVNDDGHRLLNRTSPRIFNSGMDLSDVTSEARNCFYCLLIFIKRDLPLLFLLRFDRRGGLCRFLCDFWLNS